jgi:glycine/D-amino acid oxidase-like deaminating enzyme
MNLRGLENTVSNTWTKPLTQVRSVPEQADVVIIGGGIVGVSTAWFLAKQGVDVVLCEKGHIAGEQSGRNWFWVRVQGRDTREIPMMLESLRIWKGLADEIGVDVGFTRGGCFFATGFSGHGHGHGHGLGPGAGKAIAGMLTGSDSGIDTPALRLSRFFDGSPIRPQSSI